MSSNDVIPPSQREKAASSPGGDEKNSLSSSAASQTGEVVFEDYLHYAAVQRREEAGYKDEVDGAAGIAGAVSGGWMHNLSAHKGRNVNVNIDKSTDTHPMSELEEEKARASKSLRLAGWASIFYLITTDILGPFNAPFAISQVGWVPGIILYFFMGVLALYTGLILWRLYIRLDSPRYPLRTYADIAHRIYGKKARALCNVLQSVQLIINVATICLSNGQNLSQLTKGKLCFAVCILVWVFVGWGVGQIRTLKNFSWLANSAVWINLLVIFTSMGFIAHGTPNFLAASKSLGVSAGPVVTAKFVNTALFNKVNGIMQMVFAYGGAMIFPEMMAEMRRPMDFWKGMTMAQALIFTVYLLYGAFVYGFQGQFTLPLAYQGVSKFAFQTVGNALSLVTGIIAAGLYGNIGIKVVYITIVEDWFRGPPLMSTKGRIIWTSIVFVYWALAFIIASAIPQVASITTLVAALAIMQFTYTFPPFLRVGYDVITDAMAEDQEYVPGSGAKGRIDTWRQWSRWKRGIFGGRWYYKLFNMILTLGGLAMALLGMWAAGEVIKTTFQTQGAPTSFSCNSPVA